MHNFSRSKTAPKGQDFYQDIATATTEQLNDYTTSRKLKFLGLNWLAIKDETKKIHSPFKKRKGDTDTKKLNPDTDFKDPDSSIEASQTYSPNSKPYILLEKHEQEFAEEIQYLMNSKTLNKRKKDGPSPSARKTASFDVGYKEGLMESDDESPTQQRIAELSKEYNMNNSSKRGSAMSSSILYPDSGRGSIIKAGGRKDILTKTLAKIAEADAGKAADYKNTLNGRRQTQIHTHTSLNSSFQERRASQTASSDNQSGKGMMYKRLNETAGPKMNPKRFYDSPSDFINSSMGLKNDRIKVFGGRNRIKNKNNEDVDYSNAISVFDRSFAKESDISPNVLFKNAINLDGNVVTNDRNQRLKLPLSHGMEHFLKKFSDKPGKKVYASSRITEEKVRNEAFAKKVISDVFEDYLTTSKRPRSTRSREIGTEESFVKPHLFPQSLRAYKQPVKSNNDIPSLDITLNENYSSKARVNTNIGKRVATKEGGKASAEDNKPLAELLFERFRSKLPEVHTNKLLRPSMNVFDHAKAPVDNSFTRMRKYDAWFVDPDMRGRRLHKFVSQAKDHKHKANEEYSNQERLNRSVL